MKLIVKTTGSFMLMDPQSGDIAEHNRPSVVTATHFIQARTAAQQLKVLANDVPNHLTDSDFKKFYVDSGGNEELAVQSFVASYGPQEMTAEEKQKLEQEAAEQAKAEKEKLEQEVAAQAQKDLEEKAALEAAQESAKVAAANAETAKGKKAGAK